MSISFFIIYSFFKHLCVICFVQFPQSNVERILRKFASLSENRKSMLDSAANETSMPFNRFCCLLRNISDCIIDHDIVTLARYYQDRTQDKVNLHELLAMIHEQLKKVSYENFRDIVDLCLHHDGKRWAI